MSSISCHYFRQWRCPLKICFALSKSNSASGALSIATFIRFSKFSLDSLFLRPVLIPFWQENPLSHEALETGKWIEFFWRHLFLWKPICCSHLLDQGIITNFTSIVTRSFEIFLLKQHFCRTFVIHLTHVMNKRRSLEIFASTRERVFLSSFCAILTNHR